VAADGNIGEVESAGLTLSNTHHVWMSRYFRDNGIPAPSSECAVFMRMNIYIMACCGAEVQTLNGSLRAQICCSRRLCYCS